jgi:phosphoglucomutase
VAGDYWGRIFALDKKGDLRLSRRSSHQIPSFGEDYDGRVFMASKAGDIFRVLFSGARPYKLASTL